MNFANVTLGLLATTLAPARAAAGAAAAFACKGNLRLYRKAHVGQVYGSSADSCEKLFIHKESETIHFKILVILSRLIQSQRQARASSAAGSHIDAHRAFFLVREVAVKLFAGAFSQGDHMMPPIGDSKELPSFRAKYMEPERLDVNRSELQSRKH